MSRRASRSRPVPKPVSKGDGPSPESEAAVPATTEAAGEGRVPGPEPAVEDRVCVGTIVAAQGVRGGVRIKPFTAEPRDVAAYGPVTDESGLRSFRIKVTGQRGGVLLAQIEGVADRDAAEALRGLRLYVPRAALPEPEEEEYYHADLIGLPVELEDGSAFGRVQALYDFGAGDVIEVRPDTGGMPLLLPFTRDFVPVVDLAARRVVVAPPESLLRPGGGEPRRDEPGRNGAEGG